MSRKANTGSSGWANGMVSAFLPTFDFDAEQVWIDDHPANAGRPGVLSQGAYGARVGVPLVLELLARHNVRATFFVPGRVAETHPDRVREILAGGHEVAPHGFTHRSPAAMTEREEREELQRSLDALRTLGADPAGYRSPSWEFSPHTLTLLREAGLAYSSNLMDDIRPYVHDGGVVELPVSWLLDDAAHFWFGADSWNKKISAPSEVREIWEQEFLGIHALGGACVLTMHPQLIGRPSRLAMLDALLEVVQSTTGVWLTTCREAAAAVRTGAGGGGPGGARFAAP